VYLCKKQPVMKKNRSFSGGTISYTINGNGPCVVLLHGFLESGVIWEKFTASLSEHYTVVCPDLPGHGKSSVFDPTHTMEFMAHAVADLLNAEAITQAVITGHSMGGYVALAFARIFPDLVKGLVLFHSHASADPEEIKANRIRTIKIVKEDRQGFIKAFIPGLFAPDNKELFAPVIRQLQQESLKTSAAGIVAALNGMMYRKSGLTTLSNAVFPVLFIAGKQDSRIPLEKILAQMVLPPHAEALILDNTGHMGFVEAPETTLKTLSCFIKKCY